MSEIKDVAVQEIRNTLAVVGRECVMQGKSSKKVQQNDLIEKMFHGTENHGSVLQQFLAGKSPFDGAFESRECENNREGNELRRDGKMHDLKELLHCHPGATFTVHERGFTTDTIGCVKGDKLSGRNLNERALAVIAMNKHALRYYNEYAAANGDDPSGLKVEDMLDHVRRGMFVQFKGARDAKGAARVKNKEPLTHDDMPDKCMFLGHMAFALFGPMGPSEKRLSAFSPDGNGVKKTGRKAHREAEAKLKKSKAVTAGSTVTDGSNAVQEQVLKSRELAERKQNVRELLFVCNMEHKNTLDEIRTVKEMIKQFETDDLDRSDEQEEQLSFWCEWLNDLFKRLKRSSIKKKRLEVESFKLLEQLPGHIQMPDDSSTLTPSVVEKKRQANETTTETGAVPRNGVQLRCARVTSEAVTGNHSIKARAKFPLESRFCTSSFALQNPSTVR